MRYPSLPRIVIPIACTADWNTMRAIEADGRARLCRTCDTPVYDSRAMTRGELHRLIVKHEGSLPCFRLHRRPDGTIITGSCFARCRAGRLLSLKVALRRSRSGRRSSGSDCGRGGRSRTRLCRWSPRCRPPRRSLSR